MQAKPPITINEARKLLGKTNVELTDNQVSEIIDALSLLAKNYLRTSSSKKQLGVE